MHGAFGIFCLFDFLFFLLLVPFFLNLFLYPFLGSSSLSERSVTPLINLYCTRKQS